MVFKVIFYSVLISLLSLGFGRQVSAATQKIIVTEEIIKDVTAKYGDLAGKRIATWKRLMENEWQRDERNKLELVNRFFNQLEFVTDMSKWGTNDYWATPIEFLAVNGGDCEDFSIAKFFTLLALGVPESKLRITYVTALKLNQAHMVLTYFATPDAEPLVLDNLIKEIKPGSAREDLLPLYSFNGLGLWQAKKTGIGKRLGGTEQLKRWQELNQKILAGW